MLYTHIGERPPLKGWHFSLEDTRRIRRIIAEHAHRMILAQSPDEEIPRIRPRVENEEQFRNEQWSWQRWHEEQSTAEQQLTRTPEPPSSLLGSKDKGSAAAHLNIEHSLF